MRKLWLPFFVVAGCWLATRGAALTNNIAVTAITAPTNNERVVVAIPMTITASAVNAGTSTQTNVRVRAIIRDALNDIVYADTATVPNWLNNVSLSITFRAFTPYIGGTFRICVIAELPSDEQRSNDTLCQNFLVAYNIDLRARQVTYPLNGDTLRERTAFRVRGTFDNIGVTDQYDVPLRVQIRRCSDNQLMFQADSTVEELFFDSLPREFRFPSSQGIYDTRFLDAGCYRIAVIAMHIVEADRRNDTAFATITIIPVDNNIKADSAISPPAGSYVTSVQTLPVSVRFQNTGLNQQDSVMVTVDVRHNSGALIMRDTVLITNWSSGEYRNGDFDSFTTTLRGMYTITAIARLADDEWPYDDTLRFNLFYNYQNDIRVVAITNPQANEKKTLGLSFKPEATFVPELSITEEFWNIPAHVTIRRCFDNAVVFSADSVIPFLHHDSGAIAFRFPSRQGSYDIRDLEIGCYRMTVSVNLAIDSNRANDTLVQTFSIVDTTLVKNITVDSILFPANNAVIPLDSTSIPIAARFVNTGQSGESFVQVLAFVRNQDDSIVYSDVLFLALASMEVKDVTFKPFTPSGYGVFRVYTMVSLSGDTRPADDTLMHRIFRGYVNDVAAVAITSPTPNQQIPEGQNFALAGQFRWQGGFEGQNNIPVNFTIRKCGDTTVAYSVNTWIPGLTGDMGKTVQTFPSQNGGTSVSKLAPGCYTATMTALFAEDMFRVNDTATVTFTITPGGAVENATNAFTLAQNYPNPATTSTAFDFTLSEPGYVTLRISDVRGKIYSQLANTYFTEGTHTHVASLSGFANGLYVYELTLKTPDGRIHRQSNVLSIIK